ncbi:fungal zn(2)-Cys(6) binuclear cluster domain-containing protein [Sarocladium implicatum]|nr:fungal zn(2)-Cys(6) binuclear cluster domain-containing protein [Sarocladium implicatum]
MANREHSPQPNEPVPAARSRPAARGTASYQRRRAVTACQVCRARRTKCDNLKPSCSFCLKTGATCIQSPVDLSSFDPASLKILERLDQLEDLISRVSLVDADKEEERAHKRRAIDEHQAIPIRAVKTPETLPPLDKTAVFPSDLDDILATWPSLQTVASLHNGAFNDASPGQDSLTGTSTQSSSSGLVTLDLEPSQVNRLLDGFFSYVHVKNPIFDERVTRRVIRSTLVNGIDWSSESCISLLVCALGSIAKPFGPEHEPVLPGTEAYANAMAFFQAGQKRLGILLCSDETLVAAQCFFLSGVFMMCIFQETKAWRYFMQALAHCQQLRFLSPRSQRRYHAYLDNEEGEFNDFDSLHQAIYWSAWKSEREMRGHLALPDFSPHDHGSGLYPNFFPTPPSPQSEDGREGSDRSWYFYLAEISLRRLAARISDDIAAMQQKHTHRRAYLEAAAASVPSFEAQLNEWIDCLPSFLSFSEPAEQDDVCRFVLRGHAINLYELIYWPFLSAHLDANPLDPASLEPFTHLAHAAINHHVMRLEVNEPGYRHRHHGTAPMLRSCSRSATILVAAWRHNMSSSHLGNSESKYELNMPAGWQELVRTFIGALEYWGTEFQNLDGARQVLSCSLSNQR